MTYRYFSAVERNLCAILLYMVYEKLEDKLVSCSTDYSIEKAALYNSEHLILSKLACILILEHMHACTTVAMCVDSVLNCFRDIRIREGKIDWEMYNLILSKSYPIVTYARAVTHLPPPYPPYRMGRKEVAISHWEIFCFVFNWMER